MFHFSIRSWINGKLDRQGNKASRCVAQGPARSDGGSNPSEEDGRGEKWEVRRDHTEEGKPRIRIEVIPPQIASLSNKGWQCQR